MKFLYTPFGEFWVEEASEVDISHITRFFTNQQYDKESGLYYYNARYYDPHLGSFITPDPAMDGLNHYTYCNANPIKYTDPTGLLGEDGEDEFLDGPGIGPPDSVSGDRNDDGVVRPWEELANRLDEAAEKSREFWENIEQKMQDKASQLANKIDDWYEDHNWGRPCLESLIENKFSIDNYAKFYNHTNISIGYTHASSSGINIPWAYHSFVIATNPLTNQQYITRGGPLGPGGGKLGSILAWSGKWNEGSKYDKPSEVLNIQYIGTVNLTFNEVVKCMSEFTDLINSNQISYNPLTRNSNSYAFTFVESLGFQRPEPIMNGLIGTIAWRTNLFDFIK